MASPEPDHQIQATSSATSAPPPDALDRPQGNDITGRQRTRLGGTVFGALAGIPLGGLVSAVCCWLTDFGDYAWEGALVGALLGLGGGAGIGFLERTIRGDLLNPEIATIISGIFGLLVALLLLAGLGEDVAGKFRAFLFLGILCAGPAGGLLVGAFLDRAPEASRQGSWGWAIGFAGFAIVACAGVKPAKPMAE